MKNCKLPDFGDLTPDMMIQAVEDALDIPFTSLAAPLPSYINRVYEFQAEDSTRYIAKFYRPGRWTKQAIEDEHVFVLDCAADDIPVVAPLPLASGKTIAEANGVFYAVYPKRFGRELELSNDENWIRLGTVIARMHNAGSLKTSEHRLRLHPENTTIKDINLLLEGGFLPPQFKDPFKNVCFSIYDEITAMFDDAEEIRIHGDCHRGNILERPGEGIMIIDFDDMMVGPAVQDMWLLLPDHVTQCQYQIDLLVEGYEQFRTFDDASLRLIEPLRAMRIIYFLAWCSRQIDDFKFQTNFPDWGSDSFWRTEIADLNTQLKVIQDTEMVINRKDTPTYSGRVLTDH
jgi:Ser/Thr protein kinase RdoA (MazF antagonist)